jgi:hypothetical protein
VHPCRNLQHTDKEYKHVLRLLPCLPSPFVKHIICATSFAGARTLLVDTTWYYLILHFNWLALKVNGCKWSDKPWWTFLCLVTHGMLGMTSLEGLQDLVVRVLLLPRRGSGVSQSVLKWSTLHIFWSTLNLRIESANIYDIFGVLVRPVRLSGSPEVWANWLEHSLWLHTRGCSDQTTHPTDRTDMMKNTENTIV